MRAGLRHVDKSSPAYNEETQHEQAEEEQDCAGLKSVRGNSGKNLLKKNMWVCELIFSFLFFCMLTVMFIYWMCNLQKNAMFGLHCDR